MRFYIILLIVVLWWCDASAEWTTIDFPEADHTDIWAIENDVIIGNYLVELDSHVLTYDNHVFTYDWGEWNTLAVPGAMRGADGDSIVGYHSSSSYVFDGKNLTQISKPGATFTTVYDVDGNRVVGDFIDGPTRHGFVYDGHSWETVIPPGSVESRIMGIEGNTLVGNFRDDENGDWHGFVFDGESWTVIDSPDGSDLFVWGVDGGAVMGRDGSHGFLFDGEAWTTIDFPGALWTLVLGRSGDRIFGKYEDASNQWHGFILTDGSLPIESRSMGDLKAMFR